MPDCRSRAPPPGRRATATSSAPPATAPRDWDSPTPPPAPPWPRPAWTPDETPRDGSPPGRTHRGRRPAAPTAHRPPPALAGAPAPAHAAATPTDGRTPGCSCRPRSPAAVEPVVQRLPVGDINVRESRPAPRGQPQAEAPAATRRASRSEEHTSELQSRLHLVCRLLLEKKKSHQLPCRHAGTRRLRLTNPHPRRLTP